MAVFVVDEVAEKFGLCQYNCPWVRNPVLLLQFVKLERIWHAIIHRPSYIPMFLYWICSDRPDDSWFQRRWKEAQRAEKEKNQQALAERTQAGLPVKRFRNLCLHITNADVSIAGAWMSPHSYKSTSSLNRFLFLEVEQQLQDAVWNLKFNDGFFLLEAAAWKFMEARTPWHSWRRWEKPTISFKSRTDMDASIDCNETVKGRSENRKIRIRRIHQPSETSKPRWFRPHRASKLWLTRTRSDFVSVWCGASGVCLQPNFVRSEIATKHSNSEGSEGESFFEPTGSDSFHGSLTHIQARTLETTWNFLEKRISVISRYFKNHLALSVSVVALWLRWGAQQQQSSSG